jgi:hypothetical protein
MTGISEVALVVFVRKNLPEIQYLKTSINEKQCKEFGQLVGTTIDQIEAAQFPSHSGIRFPQNGCVSCAHLGLCLGNQTACLSGHLEQTTLHGLTSLWTNGGPMLAPDINRKRAAFVLCRIDDILS